MRRQPRSGRWSATASTAVVAALSLSLSGAFSGAAAMRPGAGPDDFVSGVHPRAVAGATGCPQRTLARLSIAERVGQLFMVGVDTSPTPQQLDLVARDHLGGVLLAHDSRAGVAATRVGVRRTQQAATARGVRLWIAADQEGGYVQHLKGAGFSDIPTALAQGRVAPGALRARARSWGDELRAAGVNLNLGPVADTVSTELGGANAPIGYYYREYGHRPGVVASHALAVHRGMRDAHVSTTAKHFPGLGQVRGNTDVTSGVTDHTTVRHGRGAVRPFRALIADHVPVVMMSSARYARIDAEHIAAMSATIMRGMLRHDLGFRGTIMSDDLGAEALSHVPSHLRALRFLRAGGDVALVGSPSAADAMYRAVLRAAREHRHHGLVDEAAVTVLRTKFRQGLLPCSPP